MYIYYFILIIVSLSGIGIKNKEYKFYYISFVFLVLVLISSLREYQVGGDLVRYLPGFDEIAKTPITSLLKQYDKFGFFFKLIVKLSSYISTSSTCYLFIFSLLNLSGPLYLIYKYSNIPWLSVFLFITFSFYTNTFNSLRSSLALSVSIFGIIALINNKKLRAFIFFIIALEIHKTIFPVFLLFFITKKITYKKILIPVISSVLLSHIIGISAFGKIINLYESMNAYKQSEVIEEGGKGYSLLLLDLLITLACFYFYNKKFLSKDIKDNTFFIMLILGTCIQAFAPLYSLFTRVALFFMFYEIILIPNCIHKSIHKIQKSISILAITFLMILYFNFKVMTKSNYNTNSQGTIPYYFYWEKRPYNQYF